MSQVPQYKWLSTCIRDKNILAYKFMVLEKAVTKTAKKGKETLLSFCKETLLKFHRYAYIPVIIILSSKNSVMCVSEMCCSQHRWKDN